jgi:PmbA protein
MNSVNRILDKCIRAGAEMAEVFNLSQKTLSISVRDGKVESVKKATPGGLAIRFFSFGKSAFAHTTDTSNSAIDSIISRLSKLARKTGEDKFATLPEPQKYKHNLDIYDSSFIDIPTESKIDYLLNLEEIALKYDILIKKSNGVSYHETITTHTLVNSNGVEMSYDSTSYNVEISVVASKKGEMYPGEGFLSARHFRDLPKPEKIVEKFASKAVRLIGGTTVTSGDYEIIFTPKAALSILWGLSYALNGENGLKGSSFLTGKKGTKIAVDNFSVYDDALMLRGIASRPADDEGTASMKLTLLEKGVLHNFMYDIKNAAKAGVSPTASASRRDFNSFPDISPSNFYIAPGNDKVEDVVASCKKGIIVEDTQGWGLHSISGQYSAGINGILVKNGKWIKPVANVTIAASAEEILDGLVAICDDITFYRRFSSPTLMVKRMKVGS